MKIHCFIFNWPGKTPYAKTLEQQLTNIGYYPTVINSDPDYQPFNWINLGNQAYFGAQWHLAVSLFQADLFFLDFLRFVFLLLDLDFRLPPA